MDSQKRSRSAVSHAQRPTGAQPRLPSHFLLAGGGAALGGVLPICAEEQQFAISCFKGGEKKKKKVNPTSPLPPGSYLATVDKCIG